MCRRLTIAFLLALLAVLALGCRKTAVVSLLPATSAGRIEAAVVVPADARLSLAWHASDPGSGGGAPAVQVWAHRRGEPGELLQTLPFDAAAPEASASISLDGLTGETCLLRVTSGSTPVAWTRAELSGAAWLGHTAAWRVAPRRGAPDVVVYMIDTLRPDVLGVYGGPGPTPVIDRLASEGVAFERAYSTTSWTRPAVASLFTALPVAAHKVANETFALPEGVLTLAEQFRLRGYQTVGAVANGHVLSSFNFDQGFEVYDWPPLPEPAGPAWDPGLVITNLAAEEVHALALRRLGEVRDPERPLFLYIHTVDPHSPYRPPRWLLEQERPALNVNNVLLRNIEEGDEAALERLPDLALSYRGAVAYADQELGRFLHGLAAYVDPGRSFLAVTADHGEAFFEHHLVGHRHWLYEELIRIPLILRGPGIPAGRRDVAPASLVDLAPTLLRLADQAAGSGASSPAPDLLAGVDRPVFMEFLTGIAVVQGEWKLTYQPEYPESLRFALFNLRQDPAERIDLLAKQPEIARRLQAELRDWRASAQRRAVEPLPVNAAGLSPALLQNLRALGYIN
jgi:choline-sulfatase